MSMPTETLSELHALHQRATAIRDQLESGPKAVQARRTALNAKKSALDNAKKTLQDEKLLQQKRESHLKTQQSKTSDLRTKLNVIKKQDEYNTIMKQLQTDATAIRMTEEQILESMQKVETQTAEVAAQEAEFQKLSQELDAFASQIESQNVSRKTQLAEITTQIITAEGAIPPEYRDQYARVTKQRGADSMAAVEDSVCTGCYVQVTTQSMNDLINAQELIFCKVCGRLQYLAPDQLNVLKRKGRA